MAKTQFEALIEHIINDEEDAARELLHDIVVQTSRQIYNEMAAEDENEEENDDEEKVEEGSFGEAGDMSDDMIDDVEADEDGMDMEKASDELGDEMGAGDEEGEELEAGEGEIEDRVVDLEAALDELKAEFDNLMSQEAGEEEHSGMDDMGGDDMGGDDMGGDDMNPMGGMGMPKEGMVREYVEKVKHPSNTEGQTIGTGASDKPGVNSKSIIDNMKNDMGGSAKNLVRGGAESAPDGNTAYKKPSNMYAKGMKDSEYASRNVNQVGGNKGASDFYNSKAKAKTGEEGGTNDKSILKKS
jgi:hypothetical protein